MNTGGVNISNFGFNILQIETKSTCNMQCKFCPYPDRPDKRITLSEEFILNSIDSLEVTDNVFKYICFSSFNEPLLDQRIYDFIKHSKRRKLPVMIITNGLLFNSREIIDKLIDSNPRYIKISVQVSNSALFKLSRGVSFSFQEYKRGVLNFLKAVLYKPPFITIDFACNFLSSFRNIKTMVCGLERGDPHVYDEVDDLRSDVKSFLNELKKEDSR